jgi:hypothetical protein
MTRQDGLLVDLKFVFQAKEKICMNKYRVLIA